MKCVIIAAGKGSRLSARAPSKPLIPVCGVPLIERVIRSAASSGVVDEFCVVTGYRGDAIDSNLSSLATSLDEARISSVHNGDWDKGNGLSVLAAGDLVGDDFLLLMADHLFDPAILHLLVQSPPTGGVGVHLAVDFDLENDLVDLDDVTRVRVRDGVIDDIGKGLAEYNGYDTGIFHCTRAILDAIETSSARGDTSLSDGMRVLTEAGKARAVDIGSAFWMDVDDESALARAEQLLAV